MKTDYIVYHTKTINGTSQDMYYYYNGTATVWDPNFAKFYKTQRAAKFKINEEKRTGNQHDLCITTLLRAIKQEKELDEFLTKNNESKK